jgi:hypothetical protein
MNTTVSSVTKASQVKPPVVRDGAVMKLTLLNARWEDTPGTLVNGLIPPGLSFTAEDRKMPRRLCLNTLGLVLDSMPVATTDVLLVARLPGGQKSVLTLIRNNEPLKGFRFMIGGRSTVAPEGHPWRRYWEQAPDVCNVLLTVFSEVSVEPRLIRRVTPLAEASYRFKWTTPDGREERFNNSAMYVAELRDDVRIPDVKFDSQSSGLKWVSYHEFKSPEMQSELCEIMKTTMLAVFRREFERDWSTVAPKFNFANRARTIE